MAPVSRRRFLMVASCAGIGGAAAGRLGFSRYGIGPALWIERVIREHLRGWQIDEESLGAYARESLEGTRLALWSSRFIVRLDYDLPLVARRPPAARERLEVLERGILSDFLLGSNFFWLKDPVTEVVTYSKGTRVCANPFARLRAT